MPVLPSPVTSEPLQKQVQVWVVGEVQKPELVLLVLQLQVGLTPPQLLLEVIILLTGKLEAKVFGEPSVKNRMTRKLERFPSGMVGTLFN